MNKPCCCNNHNGTICSYHKGMFDPEIGPWQCDIKCPKLSTDCYNVTTCGFSIKRSDLVEK